MRKSLFVFIFAFSILYSISMPGNQTKPAPNVEGVDFVKKSLSETLAMAGKQNKLVMLDAFSFN